jgi:hypothetical protein
MIDATSQDVDELVASYGFQVRNLPRILVGPTGNLLRIFWPCKSVQSGVHDLMFSQSLQSLRP